MEHNIFQKPKTVTFVLSPPLCLPRCSAGALTLSEITKKSLKSFCYHKMELRSCIWPSRPHHIFIVSQNRISENNRSLKCLTRRQPNEGIHGFQHNRRFIITYWTKRNMDFLMEPDVCHNKYIRARASRSQLPNQPKEKPIRNSP